MAQLFVVPKQSIGAPPDAELEETDNIADFDFTGNIAVDLATAVKAIAFLLEFSDMVGGPDGLRACADQLRAVKVPQ